MFRYLAQFASKIIYKRVLSFTRGKKHGSWWYSQSNWFRGVSAWSDKTEIQKGWFALRVEDKHFEATRKKRTAENFFSLFRWRTEWGDDGYCTSGPFGFKMNPNDGFKYVILQVGETTFVNSKRKAKTMGSTIMVSIQKQGRLWALWPCSYVHGWGGPCPQLNRQQRRQRHWVVFRFQSPGIMNQETAAFCPMNLVYSAKKSHYCPFVFMSGRIQKSVGLKTANCWATSVNCWATANLTPLLLFQSVIVPDKAEAVELNHAVNLFVESRPEDSATLTVGPTHLVRTSQMRNKKSDKKSRMFLIAKIGPRKFFTLHTCWRTVCLCCAIFQNVRDDRCVLWCLHWGCYSCAQDLFGQNSLGSRLSLK